MLESVGPNLVVNHINNGKVCDCYDLLRELEEREADRRLVAISREQREAEREQLRNDREQAAQEADVQRVEVQPLREVLARGREAEQAHKQADKAE